MKLKFWKLFLPNLLYLNPLIAQITVQNNDVLDFEKETNLAKDWGQRNYNHWEKNITNEEKAALRCYTGFDYQEINNYLLKTNGVLVRNIQQLPDIKKILFTNSLEEINQKIELIESALLKTKTFNDIFVYRKVWEPQFALEKNSLRKNNKIHLGLFKKIKDQYLNKEIKLFNFVSTSLIDIKKNGKDLCPIIIKIKVFKGTHALYLEDLSFIKDEHELLINRNYSIKYEKFSIINKNGQEFMKIEGALNTHNFNY